MNLRALRKEIDAVDAEIVGLIAERLRIAEEIGREKRKDGKLIVDGDREQTVMRNIKRVATAKGVSVNHIEAIYEQIIKASRRTEELIVN
jgi:chorismate mutase/prephenate dehydratase